MNKKFLKLLILIGLFMFNLINISAFYTNLQLEESDIYINTYISGTIDNKD